MEESRRSTAKDVQGPDNAAEDVPSFRQADLHDAFQFYRQNGFVVIRKLIPEEYCTRVRTSFAAEVKPYAGRLPRISGNDEFNRFDERGFLLNALMNVQRKSTRGIPTYIADVFAVLTHKNLKDVLEAFFEHRVIRLTWNHFEANPVTLPHFDSYFWARDMAFGEVVGVWIALENIHRAAGRLYVYPRSHTVDMTELLASSGQPAECISPKDSHYQRAIVEMVKSQGWTCTAPSLNAGDVLLWDSRTIHGSLVTTAPDHSRSSLTCHFSSRDGRFNKEQGNGIAVVFSRYILKALNSLWRAGRVGE